mgnify:CR=1 FL=1
MEDENIKELEEERKGKHAGRTYNFFRPVGQFIEHVDTVNFSMDKDGNFLFENIGQSNGTPKDNVTGASAQINEELFHFVHPELDETEAWRIHDAVKRVVRLQGIQMICQYLMQLKGEKNVLLPPNPSVAYAELVRMGMPDGEGFNETTFRKYYNKPIAPNAK